MNKLKQLRLTQREQKIRDMRLKVKAAIAQPEIRKPVGMNRSFEMPLYEQTHPVSNYETPVLWARYWAENEAAEKEADE